MPLFPYQERVKALLLSGQSVILQAPTGAGKTRAALAPFIESFFDMPAEAFPRKCIYSVPMRVLANQFNEEFSGLAASYKRKFKRHIHVARQTGEYREDPEFHNDLIFATIDQVLSSWLLSPYSLSKRKSNLNAGALVGSYLILDEFHLFDPDSTLPTTLHMLKTLNGVSPFLLMTATFSQEMLHALAKELNAVPILLTPDDLAGIPAQQKERYFYTVEEMLVADGNPQVDHILATHLKQPSKNQRSLVVCNQVERAQKVYEALLAKKPDTVEIRLLHSRFLREDRQRKEEEVRREFHKEMAKHTLPSLILVGTQVVEVGLDISCHALHTELAPASSILQRAGRCARYQKERGDVYVYPVENYAPYHGKEAQEQCERTWAWLQQKQGCHLDFADEQALINDAQTPTDKRILEGVQGTSYRWKEHVEKAWKNAGNRSEVSKLVRNIQAVTVVVHSDPDQLCHAPFQTDSFSLHPGTLQSKFVQWQEANNSLDPDWDEGRLSWLAKFLEEEEADEASAQDNQPIQYRFVPVERKSQLFAPLVAIHPKLVGYSSELGLTLYASKSPTPYECKVPAKRGQQTYTQYGYKKESYRQHIELVYEVFVDSWEATVSQVGQRIEQTYGWQTGIVADMARLVVWLHDAGKLSVGWQRWANQWQSDIGRPLSPLEAVAHTDYDPRNKAHEALTKKIKKKRPPHAVESALVALKILHNVLPEPKQSYRPLLQAGFTAICRHHTSTSSTPNSYELIENYDDYLRGALDILPASLRGCYQPRLLQTKLDYDQEVQRFVNTILVDAKKYPVSMLCYMLFIRALRFSDQEGTKKGSSH